MGLALPVLLIMCDDEEIFNIAYDDEPQDICPNCNGKNVRLVVAIDPVKPTTD